MISAISPTTLSPEQRLGELATILAAGVLRLRDRNSRGAAAVVPAPTSIRAESVAKGLEVPAETVLSVAPRG